MQGQVFSPGRTDPSPTVAIVQMPIHSDHKHRWRTASESNYDNSILYHQNKPFEPGLLTTQASPRDEA